MDESKRMLIEVLDELDKKKKEYKGLFQYCFVDKNEYNLFLVETIPIILGENNDNEFEKIAIDSLFEVLEKLKETYGKSYKECLKMLFYACLDGMIKIGDLFGITKDISNTTQLQAYQEYNERREVIRRRPINEETIYVDNRGLINIEETNELNETILIIEDLAAAVNILEYSNRKLIFLNVTDRGFRTYLLKASSLLNMKTEKALKGTLEAETNIIEIKEANRILLNETQNTQKRIERIEENFLTYMSIFIAVFSLIGINYSYVAKIIQHGDINGVILLNGSVVVALTTIFMLLNLLKIDAIRCESESYKKGIRTRGFEFLFIMVVEVVATGILYSNL